MAQAIERSNGAGRGILGWFAVLATAAAIAACGGGGDLAGNRVTWPFVGGSDGSGDGGGTPAPTSAGSVTVTVISADNGQATNEIRFNGRATVEAVVKDGSGRPVGNALVRFAASDGLTTLTPAIVFSPAASALTDSNGRASVGVEPQSLSTAGAFSIGAAALAGNEVVAGSVNVVVAATAVTLGTLVPQISPLSAYGTTVLSVPIGGVAATVPVNVRFTSNCASLVPARATITALVTSVNGVARATYVDQGCGGADQITATVDGSTVSTSASLAVVAPTVANVQFVSATPTVIALKGTGGVQGPGSLAFPEISIVRFRVVDQAGNAVTVPTNVSLRLSNDTGGITIDGVAGPVTRQTDASGEVSVQVQSGTIPTPLWVIASISSDTTSLTTNSVQLAVSTGQPIQSRFSLSATEFNIEGWSYDNVTAEVLLIAADAMGNPAPDGTAISFVSDAGLIEANCQTGVANPSRPLPGGQNRVAGMCASQLVSQGLRPANGRFRAGAFAVGEEHYTDTNSNNRYDLGEAFNDQGYFYLDRNENGAYDAGERIIPYLTAQSGACAANPLTSSVPATCDGVWGRAHVRQQATFVFSGSFGFFRSSPTFTAPNATNIATSYSLGASCSAFVSFWLQDLNGNPMPARTTVRLDVAAAPGLVLVPAGEQVVPSSNARGGTLHSFALAGLPGIGGTCLGTGPVLVRVTTPKGNTTDLFLSITP